MPLTLVRAADARTLWDTCVERFLQQVGDNPGPAEFDAHIWLAQESQVDLLYETAVARGVKGWLGPPVTTMRQLAARFEIRQRRVGLLTRRRLISRIAGNVAREVGMQDPSRSDGVVRGHMLDALFGELMPEGVSPEQLAEALDEIPGDRFSRRRNDWIVQTYAGYLRQLRHLDRIDTRQTSALIAAIVDAGGLRKTLRGAKTLHVYGLYMTRSRRRLLSALAQQAEVDVRLYVLSPAADDPEADEWDAFAKAEGCRIEELAPKKEEAASTAAPKIHVQPTPDTQRETEWVARQVKRLLVQGDAEGGVPEPHRIAVVARSGHEDTGRIHRALRDAGVTATTIVRSRLTEIAALKALLSLFRGAASNWTYRTLRPVLDNALFELKIDLRTIDFIASSRRVEGLAEWEAEIERLLGKLRDVDPADERGRPKHRSVWGCGLYDDAVERDLERFRTLRPALESLGQPRSESDWIELTLQLLRDQHPAAFHLRRRLCDPVGERDDTARQDTARPETVRYDIVRLDQRGLRQAELLLREWLDLDHPNTERDAREWHQLLRRMLEANELSITTPIHKGVQVLEAHDAALLPFEHVFVIHANDGVFPRPIPAGGVLGNTEREALRDAGIPMSYRDLELQRERALWRSVTSAGAVTVTYRSADPAGTPLLPSLLVPEHDPATELPRTRTRYEEGREDFVPVTAAQANRAAAVTLHDYLAATGGGESGPPTLHPGTPELLPHAVLAAVAESYRDTGAVPLTEESPALRPNPWNGWLRDPRVLQWLGKRYSEQYTWSASGLEAYSRLPFQFLLDRVLRYEEGKEADEEVTPLVFGSAAHDLLEKFYQRIKDDLPAEFTARAEEAFEAAAAEVLAAAQSADEWLGAEVLWDQQWKRIREQVRAYLEWELVHLADKGERPDLIEHEFGFHDARVFIEGKDVGGRAAKLRLCGRIDRVDQGSDGAQVLDYKSGSTPGANDYLDGTALQAPLYMQVLENEGRQVSMGYYRSLKPAKKPTQYAGKIKRTEGKYSDALRYALSIPGRIREGLFEPVLSNKSRGWASWYAGRDIARSQAELQDGNRYEHLEPLQPERADIDVSAMQQMMRDAAARPGASAPPPPAAAAPAGPAAPAAPAAPADPAADAAADPAAPARLPFDDPSGGDDA